MTRSLRSSMRFGSIVVEIVLIFIGISLAIQFENWNEGRRERADEVSLLTSIRDELLKDTIDISVNSWAYSLAIGRDSTILSQLTSRRPIDPATVHYFQDMLHNVDFTYQNSAYETLKSRGLHLIRNADLRSRIVSLYGFEYKRTERMENGGGIDQRIGRIADYFFEHFQLDESGNVVPLDYEAVLNDRGFHLLLSYTLDSKWFLRKHYADLLSEVTELVADIDREISR